MIVATAVFYENDKYEPQVFKVNVYIMIELLYYDIEMLYYGRTDFSEGIDINKTSEQKKRDVCDYWYFLNKGFTFQPYACNRCHDLLIMSLNLRNCYFKNSGYRCITTGISKSEPINLMQNINLTGKSRTL